PAEGRVRWWAGGDGPGAGGPRRGEGAGRGGRRGRWGGPRAGRTGPHRGRRPSTPHARWNWTSWALARTRAGDEGYCRPRRAGIQRGWELPHPQPPLRSGEGESPECRLRGARGGRVPSRPRKGEIAAREEACQGRTRALEGAGVDEAGRRSGGSPWPLW